MATSTVERRAQAVLRALGSAPATRAASGRYQRSEPIAPGVRYWASSLPRLGQDLAGVQFYGEGIGRAALRQHRFEQAGFGKRTPQASQLTFAKTVSFGPDGSLDEVGLRAVRDEVDSILNEAGTAMGRGAFRRFMLASPLAEVELTLPDRGGPWRPGAV